jgi:hypothetical protein
MSSSWSFGEKIQTIGDLELAVSHYGFGIQISSAERGRAHRILAAGAIEPHEYTAAAETTKAKSPARAVSYWLGCVETGRKDAELEAAKPSAPPRPKDARQQIDEAGQSARAARFEAWDKEHGGAS